MTAFNAAFKYFADLQEKKGLQEAKRWISIYFVSALHFVTVVVMTGFRTLILKLNEERNIQSSLCKMAATH